MLAGVASLCWIEKEYGAPYIANVTTGWDSSPRCCPTDRYENPRVSLPVLEGTYTAKCSRAPSS